MTLRLSLEGREVSLQKDFPKVLAAPALGQRVQVLYRRSTGEWALWKDIRSWWVLWAILAATAVAVFLLLLLGGRTVASGGKFDDIMQDINRAVEESGFFRALKA